MLLPLPLQILVVIFSVVSGLVSLYFMANRQDGVTEIGEIRQGLEWITMFLWIVVCLLMAHLTPTVGSDRVSEVFSCFSCFSVFLFLFLLQEDTKRQGARSWSA